MHDVKVAMKETTPDFYTYNFAGLTGKFFIQPDYSIVKKERNNLKIAHCMECSDSYMLITDENGNGYRFADVEETRTVADDQASTDAPLINSYSYNSSWYLSSITSVNGREKMLFEYYTTSEHALTQNSFTNRSATYSTTYTSAYPGFYRPPAFNQEATTITPPAVYASQKFLKRITLLRDNRIISYIDFESSPNLRQDADFTENRILQRIKVYSTLNNVAKLVKDFSLSHSYFANTNNTFTKKTSQA